MMPRTIITTSSATILSNRLNKCNDLNMLSTILLGLIGLPGSLFFLPECLQWVRMTGLFTDRSMEVLNMQDLDNTVHHLVTCHRQVHSTGLLTVLSM